MSMWRRLIHTFAGGAYELDGDNLVNEVVDQIAAMRTRGRQGSAHLPSEVEIVVTVAQGNSLSAVRSLLEEPGFEAEVQNRLTNRLVDVPASSHPLRQYRVVGGEHNAVTVSDTSMSMSMSLLICGGSRDGISLPIPAVRFDLSLGRGKNDLVICGDNDAYISRRAATVRRLGGHILVQSLDQGDALTVERKSGERLRPKRTIERWVIVRPGDTIELGAGDDDADKAIRLVLQTGAHKAVAGSPGINETAEEVQAEQMVVDEATADVPADVPALPQGAQPGGAGAAHDPRLRVPPAPPPPPAGPTLIGPTLAPFDGPDGPTLAPFDAPLHTLRPTVRHRLADIPIREEEDP